MQQCVNSVQLHTLYFWIYELIYAIYVYMQQWKGMSRVIMGGNKGKHEWNEMKKVCNHILIKIAHKQFKSIGGALYH